MTMADMPAAAFIRATLAMRRTDAGGRRRPIASGYRCDCRLESLVDEYTGAAVYLERATSLGPGEIGLIRLFPAFPHKWQDISPGSVVDLCEGPRVIGVATVVEVASTDER